MRASRRKILIGLGAGLGAVGVVGILGWKNIIPIRPVFTFLKFKLNISRARVEHLVRLRHPETGQVVFLLGTTHHYHYDDPAYSIWHVKAAVTGLDVDTVFLEMMADAVAEGRLGEGPMEMPFIATAAKEAGITIFGVDSGWDNGWRGRQDRMFAQVQEHLGETKRCLVTAGFMHTRHYQEQFEGIGFVAEKWSDDEKTAVLDRPLPKTWPAGFRDVVEASIARARAGQLDTDPSRAANVDWFIEIREQVLKKVPPHPAHGS